MNQSSNTHTQKKTNNNNKIESRHRKYLIKNCKLFAQHFVRIRCWCGRLRFRHLIHDYTIGPKQLAQTTIYTIHTYSRYNQPISNSMPLINRQVSKQASKQRNKIACGRACRQIDNQFKNSYLFAWAHICDVIATQKTTLQRSFLFTNSTANKQVLIPHSFWWTLCARSFAANCVSGRKKWKELESASYTHTHKHIYHMYNEFLPPCV